MVRPLNAPVRASPYINKLGNLKKAHDPKKGSEKSDSKITKKKKKQRKDKESSPQKKGKAKKKRMKKVPRAVIEQIEAMKARAERERQAPPPVEMDESRIEVVTSAAVKRVATRVGIACISNEASKTNPPHTNSTLSQQ